MLASVSPRCFRLLLLLLAFPLASETPLLAQTTPSRPIDASGNTDIDKDKEKKPVYKVVDWDQNRFVVGDPRKFERPAKIVILDVLSKIPAYQQVIKEKLTEKDPRYYFLMQEATQQLVAAVEKVTRKTGNDLVADAGAVEAEGGAGEIPDLTQAVIDALKK
jgi:hypothetical protein